MAALLAHILAVHHDARRQFAGPFDLAFVPFRMARNLAYHGQLVWNLGDPGPAFDVYPSPLWLAWCAGLEHISAPTAFASQVLGILATLATIALSSRIAAERIAGVVTALLLVASGTVAVAGASGTELPLLMLAATAALVRYERERGRSFLVAATCLATLRAESLVLLLLFVLFEVAERLRGRHKVRWSAFAVPFGAWIACACLQTRHGGSMYLAELALLRPERETLQAGFGQLVDLGSTAVTPLLMGIPLAVLCAGRLSAVGVRALALALAWIAVVVLRGGGALPFGAVWAPALPFVFLAVQQGLIVALDTGRRRFEVATWCLIGVAVSAAALASKFPGNLGPLPLDEWHRNWMTATGPVPYDQRPVLGRLAVDDEIRRDTELTSLARFLRRHSHDGTSILTPWPGRLGYASSLQVHDLFDRYAGETRDDWLGRPRPKIDVAGLLERKPDLFLPSFLSRRTLSSTQFQRRLASQLWSLGDDDPARGHLLSEHLDEYELVTLPLGLTGSGTATRRQPCYVLRRRDLGVTPRLLLRREAQQIVVQLAADERDRRSSPPQLARLQLELVDARGRSQFLDPRGVPHRDRNIFARTGLLVSAGVERAVTLFTVPLENGVLGNGVLGNGAEVRARLFNPGPPTSHPLAAIGEVVVLR